MSMLNKMLKDNEIKLGYPDLSNYKDEEKGLYILPDDDGNSIYYYGKVDNNYLKYDNELWRIIRLNGNKTVRIILNDVIDVNVEDEDGNIINLYNKGIYCLSQHSNNDIGPKCWVNTKTGNTNFILSEQIWYNDTEYSKRHRAFDNSSEPKLFTDKYNFAFGYDLYISDTHFLKIILNEYKNNNNIMHEVSNTESKFCFYNGVYNLYDSKNFFCKASNASNDDKIGLVAYKELKLSGSDNSYLTDIEKSFFTYDYKTENEIYVYDVVDTIKAVKTDGIFDYDKYTLFSDCNESAEKNICLNKVASGYREELKFKFYGVRPVVNLKSDTCFSGNGTQSDPYVIVKCKS